MYVGSPGGVTDQLHGYVGCAELLRERPPTRWSVGLSLTQQIVNEIHRVTSRNGNTLVYEFVAIAPRDVSFEMFHQSSGFGLQTLGNGVQDGSLQSSNRSILILLLILIPRFLTFRRFVHRDRAYRFLDAFVDQIVVPLQHLIIQRYLYPVIEVLSIEDGLHLLVEGLHYFTYGIRWMRLRAKCVQQSRVYQSHLSRVIHASNSRRTPDEARAARPNPSTELGRPIGNLRSVPRRSGVTRGVFSGQRSCFFEPTRVTSSCIYPIDASVKRSMECSSLVCCKRTRLVHTATWRLRWR